MSQFENKKAAALKYDESNSAPIVVAAGSGYIAKKIVEVAQNNNVPVYHDNSLATLLAQLQVGSEIPQELYQAIVDIYVYFLKYSPNSNIAQEKPTDIVSSTEQEAEINSNDIPLQGRFLDISIDK
ncbi:MAG: EscU/YscU/HrcU family type III secretion system export apparatus switch protein [Oscillospiraceae bacterium]